MNNAIQYCISDHTSAQARVPLRYLVLSAEDRWPLIVSLLEYFQEILDLSFRRYVQKPLIYDQYMVVCKLSNCTAYASSGLLCKIVLASGDNRQWLKPPDPNIAKIAIAIIV